MLNNLKRFDRSITTELDAQSFVTVLRSRQSPLIANQNLTLLNSFANWAAGHQLIPSNPFAGIKPLKNHKRLSPKRAPFSRSEVQSLLATVREDPRFQSWHGFCAVLLYLGLRPSEAIGLRWQDIDLDRGIATIADSLSRDESGRSSGAARKRKETKGGNTREIPLPKSLIALLKKQQSGLTDASDLIFKTPKGKPIDDHTFSQRIWKSLCTAANVPYRVPYACRHTVLSHGIETGTLTIHQAQHVAGHRTSRMIIETYGHMIDRPNLIDWEESG